MAKEAKAEAGGADSASVAVAPPRTSKKLIIIIVAALLVVVVAGAAAFFLMKGRANPDGDEADGAGEKTKVVKKAGKETAPVYVALDAFTVNLIPETGDQFLQLMMSVEVIDSHIGDRLKMYTPKLRNNVVMLLSSKKASEILSREGKETLANEIRDLINDILEGADKGKSEEPPVKEVLFTSFIIQ